MAIVGEAHIVVRAITTSVKDDIKKGFDGVDDTVKRAGQSVAKTFQSDFARSADQSRKAWVSLTKTSFALQTAVGSLVGGISSLVGGLGAVAGAAGGAAASVAALGSAVIALPVGMAVAKLALGGVGQAVSAANAGASGYGKSIRELNEDLQQLKFDQEEAALSVEGAGLRLERARENLLRSQDLPLASRARREAELEAKEADLAYRRALDRRNDLEEQAKNPVSRGGGGAQQDPFKDLLPSQKAFAKYLISLKSLQKELKGAAANGFLPILQEQMDRLIKTKIGAETFFSVFKTGISEVSSGLGEFTKNFTDSVLTADNLKDLASVFESIRRSLGQFGSIVGSSLGSVLTILQAAEPITRKFVSFLEGKAKSFENFLNTKQATGELTAFFNRAGELAADFGEIFGNIFGFIGDMINANFGPVSGGQYMLNWLKDATQGWKDLRKNLGKKEFDGYFFSAAINSKAVLQSVGALVKELGKLGTMREVKETFDILATGAPALGNILRSGQEAGPALAKLLVELTKIAEALSDSGAIKVFFGVLEQAASAVSGLLENTLVRTLIDIITQITAIGLAAGTLMKVATFVFGAIYASVMLPFKALQQFPAAFAAAGTSAQKFGIALRGALGIVGLISVAVMGAVELNEQWNDSRRRTVKTTEEIRNEIVAGEGAAVGFQSALKELGGGNLVFEKLKPSTLKGVADGIELVTISTDDLAENGNKLDLVLRALSDEMTGFGTSTQGTQNWFDKEADWLKIETAISNTGEALADVAGSSIPDATSEFVNLAKSYNLTDESAGYLLESMPAFKEQLKVVANQVGLATDDQTLLNIAMQKGDDYAQVLESGFGGVDAAAEHAAQQVEILKDQIKGFGDAELDTRAAQRSFQESVDAISESVKANGKTLDINTEQGRNNQAALDELARSATEQAIAIYESTGSTDEMTTSLDKGRDALIKAAEEMGMTKDKAKDLADTLLGTPEEIKISVDASTEKFDNKMTQLKTTYTPNWFETTFPDLFAPGGIFNSAKPPGSKNGGYIGRYANGGLVASIRGFAPGGPVTGAGTARSDSIPAMLSNGEYVINARATSENRELLDRINNNETVSMAPTINMTVNAAPGMNTSELVNEVSRKIAFELRNGVGI